MKYRRQHTRNGVTHKKGDAFVGTIEAGRFLFHRHVLEPNGAPEDDAITRNPSPRKHMWGLGEDFATKPDVTPVHTGGGMYDVGRERVRGKAAATQRATELNADTGDAWATPRPKET